MQSLNRKVVMMGILFFALPICAEENSPWSAEDSSVGKAPPVLADASPVLYAVSGDAVFGRLPWPATIDALPPHSAGPGLIFNPKEVFYIYTDKRAPQNHFIPSGWMGDYGDLQLDEGSHDNPADGKTCIKIIYSAHGAQGMGWAGMYWQNPRDNWGDKLGGFKLTGMTRLTFWVRGAQGGEEIATFKVGGITGDHPDSGSAEIGPVILTPEWTEYVIDLKDVNLSNIAGGFAWAASAGANPSGFTFYLDDIRFER